MGVNKVIVNGVTKLDMTDATVTPETLPLGVVAYNNEGERIVGVANFVTVEEFNTFKNELKSVKTVVVPYSSWAGSAAPFYQTISVPGITAESSPELHSNMAVNETAAGQKAYVKNYTILSQGYMETGDGTVTFYVWKKTTNDISVSLKGV